MSCAIGYCTGEPGAAVKIIGLRNVFLCSTHKRYLNSFVSLVIGSSRTLKEEEYQLFLMYAALKDGM